MAEITKVNVVQIETKESVDNLSALKKQIKDLKSQLLGLEEGTDDYNKKIKELGDAQFKLKDINEKASRNMSDTGERLSNISKLAGNATSAMAGFTGVLQLLGAENENTERLTQNIISLMAVAQSLSAVEDSIDIWNNLKKSFINTGKAISSLKKIIKGTAIGVAIASITYAVHRLNEENAKLKDDVKELSDAAGDSLTNFDLLRASWIELGDDMKAKEQFLVDNKKRFEELGLAVKSVNDAELLLVKNARFVISAIEAKADAEIYYDKLLDARKKKIETEEIYQYHREQGHVYRQKGANKRRLEAKAEYNDILAEYLQIQNVLKARTEQINTLLEEEQQKLRETIKEEVNAGTTHTTIVKQREEENASLVKTINITKNLIEVWREWAKIKKDSYGYISLNTEEIDKIYENMFGNTSLEEILEKYGLNDIKGSDAKQIAKKQAKEFEKIYIQLLSELTNTNLGLEYYKSEGFAERFDIFKEILYGYQQTGALSENPEFINTKEQVVNNITSLIKTINDTISKTGVTLDVSSLLNIRFINPELINTDYEEIVHKTNLLKKLQASTAEDRESLLTNWNLKLIEIDKITVSNELENLEREHKALLVSDETYENEKARLKLRGLELDQEYADEEVAIEQRAIDKKIALRRNYAQAASSILSGTSQLLTAIQANVDTSTKEGFEKNKQFETANATISYLQGLISAWSSSMQLGPILGPIAGGILSGLLTGVYAANITKIQNTKFGGSTPTSDIPVSESAVNALSTNITNVRNTPTDSDIIELNKNPQKVYVLTTDIEQALNSRKTVLRNSSF